MNILSFLANPFSGIVIALFALAIYAIVDSFKKLWSNDNLPEFTD